MLAVCNQKGGVGKTTSTINLGAALAGYGRGCCWSTSTRRAPSASGWASTRTSSSGPSTTCWSTATPSVVDVVQPTGVEGMDLLPANIDLSAAELHLSNEVAREQTLLRALEPVLGEYDVVLIDCQPSLGLLTVNALTAADGVLIPLECEYFALRGVALLTEIVDKVQSRLNPKLQVEGVLATMFDARTVHGREVLARVIEAFGDRVFHTVINRTIKFPETTVAGQPITVYAPSSAGAEAYRDLAREVLARRAGRGALRCCTPCATRCRSSSSSWSFVVAVHAGRLGRHCSPRAAPHSLEDPRRRRPDPRAHLDPFGTVAAALTGVGWARPVPAAPRGVAARVALAGPLVAARSSRPACCSAFGARRGQRRRRDERRCRPAPAAGPLLPRALLLVGLVHLFVGLLSLVPLPPLDGGPAAVRALAPHARAGRRPSSTWSRRTSASSRCWCSCCCRWPASSRCCSALLSAVGEPLVRLLTGLRVTAPAAFHVRLEVFEGPFDLLLQLIGKHQLDVTEVALSQVTDDFIAHIRAAGPQWDLGQATEFLVVAATLLDLKAARLLPGSAVEDEEDLALLEARDLLFARLLQYRAYKQAAAHLAALLAAESPPLPPHGRPRGPVRRAAARGAARARARPSSPRWPPGCWPRDRSRWSPSTTCTAGRSASASRSRCCRSGCAAPAAGRSAP